MLTVNTKTPRLYLNIAHSFHTRGCEPAVINVNITLVAAKFGILNRICRFQENVNKLLCKGSVL